jgi:hypothetical protein
MEGITDGEKVGDEDSDGVLDFEGVWLGRPKLEGAPLGKWIVGKVNGIVEDGAVECDGLRV